MLEQLFNLFLNSGLGHNIFTTSLLNMDRSLAKSDALALLVVHRRSESTMSELAADLGAPLSTVTGIVQRLVRRGLLSRTRSPHDRRAYLLTITEQGQAIAVELQNEIVGIFQSIQKLLTPEELQQLIFLVQKIITGLQQVPKSQNTTNSAQLQKIIIDD